MHDRNWKIFEISIVIDTRRHSFYQHVAKQMNKTAITKMALEETNI